LVDRALGPSPRETTATIANDANDANDLTSRIRVKKRSATGSRSGAAIASTGS
jgi:hypothetical protein